MTRRAFGATGPPSSAAGCDDGGGDGGGDSVGGEGGGEGGGDSVGGEGGGEGGGAGEREREEVDSFRFVNNLGRAFDLLVLLHHVFVSS